VTLIKGQYRYREAKDSLKPVTAIGSGIPQGWQSKERPYEILFRATCIERAQSAGTTFTKVIRGRTKLVYDIYS